MNRRIKDNKLTKGFIGWTIYNFLMPYNVTAYGAGVIIDKNTHERHRARLGKTANGIDQIDIVTPDDRGLSHNKFLEFNVNERGLILNNSADMSLTTLAGLIYGNDNITPGKEAKTILSEVTGLKRSEIEGFVEVAGSEADFILANANGIYMSGGGFINTPRVTLTTGQVLDGVDGNLKLRITDGIVEVAESGFVNIEEVDYFEILSRAAKIGGVISSTRTENKSTKELKVLTGDNTYDYEEATHKSHGSDGKYQFAIDASELGAMSAGKIKLIATDKGVGVNTKSNLVATLGDLEIDSQGNLEVKNAITRRGDIKLKSSEGDIRQAGEEGFIYSENNLEIDAAKDVKFQGKGGYAAGKNKVVISGENLEVKNESIVASVDPDERKAQSLKADMKNQIHVSEDSSLAAGGRMDLQGREIINQGTISGEDIYANAESIINEDTFYGEDAVTLRGGSVVNSGDVVGTNLLEVSGEKSLVNSGQLYGEGEVRIKDSRNVINSGIIAGDKVSGVNNNSITNSGTIQGTTSIEVTGKELNNSGTIYSEGSVKVEADRVVNEDTIYAKSEMEIKSGYLNNEKEGVVATEEGDLTLSGERVSNRGAVAAGRNLEIITSKEVSNLSEGQMAAGSGKVALKSEGIRNQGTVLGNEVSIEGNLTNDKGTILADKEGLAIEGERVENSGLILAKKDIEIAGNTLRNTSDGNIMSGSSFNEEGDLENSKGSLSLSAKETIENEGTLLSGEGLYIGSETIKNTGNIQNLGGKGEISSEKDIVNDGTIYSEGSLDTKAGNTLENKGDIYSTGSLKVEAAKVKNQKSILGGDIRIDAGSLLNGSLLNGSLLNEGKSKDEDEDKDEAVIYSEGSITLEAETLVNSGGIISDSELEIKVKELDNQKDGQIGGESVGIESAETLQNSGLIMGDDLEIKAKELDNQKDGQIGGESVGIESAETLQNSGLITGDGLEIKVKELKNQKDGQIGGERIGIETTEGLYNSGVIAGDDLNVRSKELNNQEEGQIAGTTVDMEIREGLHNSGVIAGDDLKVRSKELDNQKDGQIAGERVDIEATEGLHNSGVIVGEELEIKTSNFESEKDSVVKGSSLLTVEATQILNRGNLLTEGSGRIEAEILINEEGGLLGALTSESEDEGESKGKEGSPHLRVEAKDVRNSGDFYSAGGLEVYSETLENQGNISTKEDLRLISEIIKNNGAGELVSAANLIMEAEEVVNTGEILANEDVLMEIGGIGLTNKGGLINASGAISVIAEYINNNQGEILSGKGIKIHTIKLENNAGEIITNGSLTIDLTKLGKHSNDFTLTGTIYGDTLIEIRNFSDIINDQIEVVSNGDIILDSMEGDISNSKVIFAGGDLDISAKNYVRNTGSSEEEALLSSGEGMNLTAKNYIHNRDSKIYGGTKETKISLQESFVNEGKILGLGKVHLDVAKGQKVTNEGQFQSNGDLIISADEILLRSNTSLYATENLSLVARHGHIINEAGAQILTLLGDMELRAAGSIYNKADKEKAGKIKAGGNIVVEAINFYNEAIKYHEYIHAKELSKYGFMEMSEDELMKNFLDTHIYNNWINNSTYVWKSGLGLRDLWDEGSLYDFEEDLFWMLYGHGPNLVPEDMRDLVIHTYNSDLIIELRDGGHLNSATVNKESRDGGFLNGQRYHDLTLDLDFNTASSKDSIGVRQAALEAGGDIEMKLSKDLVNGGVIRADRNIDITAKEIRNVTEALEYETIDTIRVEFKVRRSNTQGGTKPSVREKSASKTTKKVTLVSEDKALISAGGKVKLTGDVKNLTTVGGIADSIEEGRDSLVDVGDRIDFEDQETIDKDAVDDADVSVGEITDDTEVDEVDEVGEADKIDKVEGEAPDLESPDVDPIKGVEIVVDPGDHIEIPEGDNGIFIRNDDVVIDGVQKPLIETNIDFINDENYYGSGYVFEKLGDDSEDDFRRLGDNYYETMLVNEMYLKATGGRKMEGSEFDEISLMKYLLDNSVLASDELGLVVGEPLTEEQMKNLDKDIVWYVKEEVDGVEVLVPRVYVSSNNVQTGGTALDSSSSGSAIVGEVVEIKGDKFENIGSTVKGDSLVSIDAGDILNKYGEGSMGAIVGGDIQLKAENDIKNIGGSISGTGNVVLETVKGDVINESVVERNTKLDGFIDEVKAVGSIGGKNVIIDSGNDVIMKGGMVTATEKASITAENNVKFDTIKLESSIEKDTAHETFKEKSTIHLGSSVSAGEGVGIKAGKDLDIIGSNVSTERGDVVLMGDKVNISGVKNTFESDYKREKNGVFSSDKESIYTYSESLTGSTIDAGEGSVKISSNKDLDILGSTIKGEGDENLLMSKEGDVNIGTIALEHKYERKKKTWGFGDSDAGVSDTILGARESVLSEHDDKVSGEDTSTGHGGGKTGYWSSPGLNESAESLHGKGFSTGTHLSEFGANGSATGTIFQYTEIEESLDATTHERSSIEGGSITIKAKNDVNLESVKIDADNSVGIISEEGDVNSTYVQDEVNASAKQTNVRVGADVGYTVPLLDIAEAAKGMADYSDSEYSSGGAWEIFARAVEMGGVLSKQDGTLVDTYANLGVSVSHSDTTTQSKTAIDSEISAKDILISAENGKVDFKGMQIEGTDSVFIKAEEFNMEASKSEYHHKEDGYYVGVSAGVGGTVGAESGVEGSINASIDGSFVDSKTDSVTYNNSKINGGNVVLEIDNDATLKGANISGESVTADIGGDLNIESVQDTLDHNLKSTDFNLSGSGSIGLDGYGGNGSAGVTHGQIVEEKEWVKEQSGITGGNVNINVGGNTALKGGVIAAEDGNLNFATGGLTVEDLKDSHMRDGGYGGLGVSVSENGVDSVDVKGGRVEGFHKDRNVNSTIGAGNVSVGGESLEDSGIDVNRDTENALETTRDDKHFKWDFDYTLEPKKKITEEDSNSLRDRGEGDTSNIFVNKDTVNSIDKVVSKNPALGGKDREPNKVTNKPDVVTETKPKVSIDYTSPKVDSGITKKTESIKVSVDSGKVNKIDIKTPEVDSGIKVKVDVSKPEVDSGKVKNIKIESPDIEGPKKLVDKVEKLPEIDGTKTQTEVVNLKKDINESIKVKEEKVVMGTPDFKDKVEVSRPKEEAGEAAKIKEKEAKVEEKFDFVGKKGSEVGLGKEVEVAIRESQEKGEDPYVATNKILSSKIKGQEDFFKKQGYKDSIGNNYDEIQKKQLHKIVKRSGNNGMNATNKDALMKFMTDLNNYDLGLKAAKAAHEAGDAKAAKEILDGIKDISKIKVDSKNFKKYSKKVKEKETQKNTSQKNKDKVIKPTQKELNEAQKNGGYFIRKENGKLVKYDIESVLKDRKYKDELTGMEISKDAFDKAEYKEELGGKAIKISEDSETDRFWVQGRDGEAPVIKEVPKYQYEKGSEKFRDEVTGKAFTKNEIQERGKIALDGEGKRFLTVDEKGEIIIETNTKVRDTGSERLQNKLGETIKDSLGNEIRLKDLEDNKAITKEGKGANVYESEVRLDANTVLKYTEREFTKKKEMDIIGVGGNNFFRNSGSFVVKGSDSFKKDVLLGNSEKEVKTFKEITLITSEKKQDIFFTDEKTGKVIRERELGDLPYDEALGGRVLKTDDPDRNIVWKEGSDEPVVMVKPKTELVPGSEYFFDKDSGKKVTEKDLENAPVNELLGKKAVEIGDGKFFTKNDDGSVGITEITGVKEIPGKAYDPVTNREIGFDDFDKDKTYNDDLGQEAVAIGDGRYFIKDDSGEIKVAEVTEVQERPESVRDPQSGRELATDDFEGTKKFNEDLGQDAVEIGDGRYFIKDDSGEIRVAEVDYVRERADEYIDPETGVKISSEDFEGQKSYQESLSQDAVKIDAKRYFVKDEAGEIKVIELSEVQERPESVKDPVSGKELATDDFDSSKIYHDELGQEAVEIGDGRYFVRDKDGDISSVKVEYTRERDDYFVDPETGAKLTEKEFTQRKEYNEALGMESVDLGDNRHFIMDKEGALKVAKVTEDFEMISHIVDPKTKKEVRESDFDSAEVIGELGERAIKIEDGRYFTKDNEGNIVVTEVMKPDENLYLDEKSGREITPEEIMNAATDSELGERAIKIEDGRYFTLNERGEVEIAEVTSRPRTDYEFIGDDFSRKITQEEYSALRKNPELDGKVVGLEDNRYLVIREDGDAYVTTGESLERRVMAETVKTLLTEGVDTGDAKRLREIISQSSKSSKLSESKRKDLEALGRIGGDKNTSDREFVHIVKEYVAKSEGNNYMDDKTGKIYDLTKDKFKKVDFSKENPEFVINSKNKLVVDNEGSTVSLVSKKDFESTFKKRIKDAASTWKAQFSALKGMILGRKEDTAEGGNTSLNTNRYDEVSLSEVNLSNEGDSRESLPLYGREGLEGFLPERDEVSNPIMDEEIEGEYDKTGEAIDSLSPEDKEILKDVFKSEYGKTLEEMSIEEKVAILKQLGKVAHRGRLESADRLKESDADASYRERDLSFSQKKGLDFTQQLVTSALQNDLKLSSNYRRLEEDVDRSFMEKVAGDEVLMDSLTNSEYADKPLKDIDKMARDFILQTVIDYRMEAFSEASGIETKKIKLQLDKNLSDEKRGVFIASQGRTPDRVVLNANRTLAQVLDTLSHELTHKEQAELVKHKRESEALGVGDDRKLLKYSGRVGDSTEYVNYLSSQREKDAKARGHKLGEELSSEKLKRRELAREGEEAIKDLDLILDDFLEYDASLPVLEYDASLPGSLSNTLGKPDIVKEMKRFYDSNELMNKYYEVSSGIKGESGNEYKLNSPKLKKLEKEFKKAQESYEKEGDKKSYDTLIRKYTTFNNALKSNEEKMDSILRQKELNLPDVLAKEGDPNDKYQGKVISTNKKEIDLIKVWKKEKRKLPKEEEVNFSKGLTKKKYYKGKPSIVQESKRPEKVEAVKDNTVNILVHGTFNGDKAKTGWISSDSSQGKAIEKQYGGESVTFQWSGKNHPDARKEAGKELAKVIEGYNEKGIEVNIISHSHGGNVANEALKTMKGGKVKNLVTLGTPVRNDHRVSREIIEEKTGSYLNVMSNEDSVTKAGGTDFKTKVWKFFTGQAKIGLAHRKDLNADKILKVDGASHNDLHGLNVIKLLRPIERPKDIYTAGVNGENSLENSLRGNKVEDPKWNPSLSSRGAEEVSFDNIFEASEDRGNEEKVKKEVEKGSNLLNKIKTFFTVNSSKKYTKKYKEFQNGLKANEGKIDAILKEKALLDLKEGISKGGLSPERTNELKRAADLQKRKIKEISKEEAKINRVHGKDLIGSHVNAFLRTGKISDEGKKVLEKNGYTVEKAAEDFDTLIRNGRSNEKLTSFRKLEVPEKELINRVYGNRIKEGDLIQDKGYLFTSETPTGEWMDKESGAGYVYYSVEGYGSPMPKGGSKAGEIDYRANTVFRVKGIETDEAGNTLVNMEEVSEGPLKNKPIKDIYTGEITSNQPGPGDDTHEDAEGITEYDRDFTSLNEVPEDKAGVSPDVEDSTRVEVSTDTSSGRSQEREELLEKVSKLEVGEKWKRLKKAVDVRYTQRLFEDERVMKLIEDPLKSRDGAGVLDLDEALNLSEKKELLEMFVENKEKAFSEAMKTEFEKANLVFDAKLPENTRGQYDPNQKKVLMNVDPDKKFLQFLKTSDHELEHKDQFSTVFFLPSDSPLREVFKESIANMDFDMKHYKNYSEDPQMYEASLIERDANKTMNRTIDALHAIADRLQDGPDDYKNKGGYIGISDPYRKRSADVFIDKNLIGEEKKLKLLKANKETVELGLNKEAKKELEEISTAYQEIGERYEKGEITKILRDTMVQSLVEKLKGMEERNNLKLDPTDNGLKVKKEEGGIVERLKRLFTRKSSEKYLAPADLAESKVVSKLPEEGKSETSQPDTLLDSAGKPDILAEILRFYNSNDLIQKYRDVKDVLPKEENSEYNFDASKLWEFEKSTNKTFGNFKKKRDKKSYEKFIKEYTKFQNELKSKEEKMDSILNMQPEKKRKALAKISNSETDRKWKKLKKATDIRYTQNLFEDKAFMDLIDRNKDINNIGENLTEEEKTKLLKLLAKNKEKAFSEATKVKFKEAELDLIADRTGKEKELGYYANRKNKVVVNSGNHKDFKEVVKTLDHELGHKDQYDMMDRLPSDSPLRKEFEQVREDMKFDVLYYDSDNEAMYLNSLIERDTRENEKRTQHAIKDIVSRLSDEKREGLVAISKPKKGSTLAMDRFRDIKLIGEERKLESLIANKEAVELGLKEGEKKELEEITTAYQEVNERHERGEISESLKDTMVQSLVKKLKEMEERNVLKFDRSGRLVTGKELYKPDDLMKKYYSARSGAPKEFDSLEKLAKNFENSLRSFEERGDEKSYKKLAKEYKKFQEGLKADEGKIDARLKEKALLELKEGITKGGLSPERTNELKRAADLQKRKIKEISQEEAKINKIHGKDLIGSHVNAFLRTSKISDEGKKVLEKNGYTAAKAAKDFGALIKNGRSNEKLTSFRKLEVPEKELINKVYGNKIKEGDLIRDRGYLFTSETPTEEWSDKESGVGYVYYSVEGYGSPMPLGGAKAGEIDYKPNTVFKVKGIEIDESGNTFVSMEEVSGESEKGKAIKDIYTGEANARRPLPPIPQSGKEDGYKPLDNDYAGSGSTSGSIASVESDYEDVDGSSGSIAQGEAIYDDPIEVKLGRKDEVSVSYDDVEVFVENDLYESGGGEDEELDLNSDSVASNEDAYGYVADGYEPVGNAPAGFNAEKPQGPKPKRVLPQISLPLTPQSGKEDSYKPLDDDYAEIGSTSGGIASSESDYEDVDGRSGSIAQGEAIYGDPTVYDFIKDGDLDPEELYDDVVLPKEKKGFMDRVKDLFRGKSSEKYLAGTDSKLPGKESSENPLNESGGEEYSDLHDETYKEIRDNDVEEFVENELYVSGRSGSEEAGGPASTESDYEDVDGSSGSVAQGEAIYGDPTVYDFIKDGDLDPEELYDDVVLPKEKKGFMDRVKDLFRGKSSEKYLAGTDSKVPGKGSSESPIYDSAGNEYEEINELNLDRGREAEDAISYDDVEVFVENDLYESGGGEDEELDLNSGSVASNEDAYGYVADGYEPVGNAPAGFNAEKPQRPLPPIPQPGKEDSYKPLDDDYAELGSTSGGIASSESDYEDVDGSSGSVAQGEAIYGDPTVYDFIKDGDLDPEELYDDVVLPKEKKGFMDRVKDLFRGKSSEKYLAGTDSKLPGKESSENPLYESGGEEYSGLHDETYKEIRDNDVEEFVENELYVSGGSGSEEAGGPASTESDYEDVDGSSGSVAQGEAIYDDPTTYEMIGDEDLDLLKPKKTAKGKKGKREKAMVLYSKDSPSQSTEKISKLETGNNGRG
ncbi:hypothetical protein PM10SUCC1_04960 [Propionigenium maris DSM 9537]|uniref:Filamentous haemagglutinin FhaB/tRNA nuclease CdiA-like TPS domain-containing protein n=1 Tax=Propionigenium maris DSM 9537 TaxID=1123000 RepID=A0A9W6GJN2_9FUSO|nr:hemagglutinin repeat-containing protein [Propionigenium maris]GLI54981.1 hypothetical protein PM10SUCC1_04960 [Propionigenium maris DSM 9537]